MMGVCTSIWVPTRARRGIGVPGARVIDAGNHIQIICTCRKHYWLLSTLFGSLLSFSKSLHMCVFKYLSFLHYVEVFIIESTGNTTFLWIEIYNFVHILQTLVKSSKSSFIHICFDKLYFLGICLLCLNSANAHKVPHFKLLQDITQQSSVHPLVICSFFASPWLILINFIIFLMYLLILLWYFPVLLLFSESHFYWFLLFGSNLVQRIYVLLVFQFFFHLLILLRFNFYNSDHHFKLHSPVVFHHKC